MGKWSELILDLLELIDDSLVLYADKLRIRSVCLSWHLQLNKIPNPKLFPCLLHQTLDDDNTEASHALFNPVDKKFYFLDLQNVLHNKIFKGSSYGWVITVEDKKNKNNKLFSDAISLINPLTQACIELPCRRKFPDIVRHHPDNLNNEYHIYSECSEFQYFASYEYVNNHYVQKIVMSSDPSSKEECLIVAMYQPGVSLACCTLNDKRWKPLKFKFEDIDDDIDDIIFHKGKLHAFAEDRVLVFENINCGILDQYFTVIAKHTSGLDSVVRSPDFSIIMQTYLVESCDSSCLMIVERFFRYNHYNRSDTCTPIPHTLYFKVYKVDQVNGTSVELKSIGDKVLVVGMTTTREISGHNSIGYKGSHIYFGESIHVNDNKRYGKPEDSDISVFDLENQRLQPLSGFKSKPKFLWPPPIWVDLR